MSNRGFRIRHSLVRVSIVLFCLLLFYNVFIFIDSDPLFMRWKLTIINMALSLVFFPLEFGGLAALAIGFIVRALFNAEEMPLCGCLPGLM
jgi:intracellular septation protein A